MFIWCNKTKEPIANLPARRAVPLAALALVPNLTSKQSHGTFNTNSNTICLLKLVYRINVVRQQC